VEKNLPTGHGLINVLSILANQGFPKKKKRIQEAECSQDDSSASLPKAQPEDSGSSA
jgi:hypothetical protein